MKKIKVLLFPSTAFIFLVILLLSTSCNSPKKVIYESGANDIADIQLILRKNNKFQLFFKDLEEKPEKKYTFKGNWTERKEMIEMQFRLDRKGLPDINALFDPSLSPVKTVRIKDQKTVEFKKSLKSIHIWGLPCAKTQFKEN